MDYLSEEILELVEDTALADQVREILNYSDLISPELQRQLLYEASHAWSHEKIHEYPDRIERITAILGKPLPQPGLLLRELVDELMPLIYEHLPEEKQNHYTQWRHTLNEWPLATILPFLHEVWASFPSEAQQHGQQLWKKVLETTRDIEPARWEDDTEIDWNIWEPDFSAYVNKWSLSTVFRVRHRIDWVFGVLNPLTFRYSPPNE
jgi:hypothetical protein